jgi:N-acetylglucosaminyldiphosphoundecaprenol N-acetyl-beta-D-mannosaminyltransferase
LMMMGARGRVLGVEIDLVDYAGVVRLVEAWVRQGGVRLVAAANTHLVGEASRNSTFAEQLAGFDLVAPDGMPLVWALRLDGWDIRDRVYGPYLMECLLQRLETGRRHLFVGGTEECLARLMEAARKINGGLQIAGTISPPFGTWDESVNAQVIKQIRAAQADVVWLALGGVRQETWLAEQRHQLPDGVYLAVGDAFALIAGMRSFAPGWMQKAGLTWLYRLLQEPRRLARRYLTYNARFAGAFLKERWQMAHGATRSGMKS